MSVRPLGFYPDSVKYTAIPKLFLTDLLPKIDDVTELKVTLYLFQTLGEKRGYPRYVTYSEMADHPGILKGMAHLAASCGGAATDVLKTGLDKAVLRGGFLRLAMISQEKQEDLFLLNTPKNYQVIAKIQSGEIAIRLGPSREPWKPEAYQDREDDIFTLYENEIGIITPAVAELLKDAESQYPVQWIKEAITESSTHNSRSWSYVEAILKTWKKEGRSIGKPRRDPEAPADASRYYEGYYGELLKQRQGDE